MSTNKPISPWSYKPWWCQPWTILLTGSSIIAGSWGLFHHFWITGLVAVPILVWMGFFLLLWPKLVMQQWQEDAAVAEQDGLPPV